MWVPEQPQWSPEDGRCWQSLPLEGSPKSYTIILKGLCHEMDRGPIDTFTALGLGNSVPDPKLLIKDPDPQMEI